MEISFDPAKSERNLREGGLPFDRALGFDFATAIVRPTLRMEKSARVDAALRQWLDEHPLPLSKAS